MNQNKISILNTNKNKARKITTRKLRLRKWRCLLLALMKSPCNEHQQENTDQKNLSDSPIARDITPWDDDESAIFSE